MPNPWPERAGVSLRGIPGLTVRRRRSMETEEHLHVIGMGSAADWEAGRGSFYYIEDKNGEKCIPVFTSPERADRFAVHCHAASRGGLGSGSSDCRGRLPRA
jgi:hypothetical protein